METEYFFDNIPEESTTNLINAINDFIELRTLTVLYFHADWCKVCIRTNKLIVSLAYKNLNIRFIRVNVDDNVAVTKHHQIKNIPAFVFFKNGTVVNKDYGIHAQHGLQAQINAFL